MTKMFSQIPDLFIYFCFLRSDHGGAMAEHRCCDAASPGSSVGLIIIQRILLINPYFIIISIGVNKYVYQVQN